MAADVQSLIEGKVFQAIQLSKKFTDSQALTDFLKQAASNKDDAITAQQVEVALGNVQIGRLLQTLNNEQLSGQTKLNTIAGSLAFMAEGVAESAPSNSLQSAAHKQKYDEEALKLRSAEKENLEQNDIRQNAGGALQIQTDKDGKVFDNRRMGQKLFETIYKEGGLINLDKKVTYTPGTTINPLGLKGTHHETSKGFHENALRAGVPCPTYNSKEQHSGAVSLMRDFMEARDEKIKELYQNYLEANQGEQGGDLAINSLVASVDELQVENNAQAPSISTTNRNLLSPQEWYNVNLETFKQQVKPEVGEKLSNQQIKDMTATYIKTLTPAHVVKLAQEIAKCETKYITLENTQIVPSNNPLLMTNTEQKEVLKEDHLQYIKEALFTLDVAIDPNARAVIKNGNIEAKEHTSWHKTQNTLGIRNTSNDKEQIAQLVGGVCEKAGIQPNLIHKGDQDQKEDLQSNEQSQSNSDAQKLDLPTTTLLKIFAGNNTTDFNNKGSQADETGQKEQGNSSNPRQESIISDSEQNNQSVNMN